MLSELVDFLPSGAYGHGGFDVVLLVEFPPRITASDWGYYRSFEQGNACRGNHNRDAGVRLLGWLHGERGRYARYFAGLALFLFSMLGIVLANNFVMMFIFWELVGLTRIFSLGIITPGTLQPTLPSRHLSSIALVILDLCLGSSCSGL